MDSPSSTTSSGSDSDSVILILEAAEDESTIAVDDSFDESESSVTDVKCLEANQNNLEVDEDRNGPISTSTPNDSSTSSSSAESASCHRENDQTKAEVDNEDDFGWRRYTSLSFCNHSLTEVAKVFERQMDQLQISFGKTLSKYKNKLETANTKIQAMEKEIHEQKDDLETKERELSKLRGLYNDAKRCIEVKKGELMIQFSLTSTISVENAKNMKKIQTLDEKVTWLEEMKTTAEKEKQLLLTTNKNLETKNKDLENQNKDLESKNKDLESKNDKLLKLVNESKEEYVQMFVSLKRKYDVAFEAEEGLEVATPNSVETVIPVNNDVDQGTPKTRLRLRTATPRLINVTPRTRTSTPRSRAIPLRYQHKL